MTANPMRLACLTASMLLATPASAAQPPAGDLVELSLEDLMQVEVTTVSKKPQALANVAAAVYVISQDDIRRSGARSIPEALRLAPGVDAARLSGNRWSVTMRGFNERFANKLLVLVDGRSAYTPLFSGVLWESLLFPLEDIERIEVIRGPGGSVWGTNAVNGVINIITKTAWSTTGGSLTAGAGSRKGSFGSLRYGAPLADGNVAYRAYASMLHSNALESATGASARDSDHDLGAGFRFDGITRGGDNWSVSADFYQTRSNTQVSMIDPTLLTASTLRYQEPIDGGNLRARWQRRLDEGSDIQLQASLAYTDLWVPYLAGDQRITFDLDFQHHLHATEAHDITWGAGYRQSDDSTSDSRWMVFSPDSATLRVTSLFAQDEISLRQDLRLTLGARLDHYNTTGTAFQPSARLLLEH
jgi:iron complex outermembrane receptor protein